MQLDFLFELLRPWRLCYLDEFSKTPRLTFLRAATVESYTYEKMMIDNLCNVWSITLLLALSGSDPPQIVLHIKFLKVVWRENLSTADCLLQKLPTLWKPSSKCIIILVIWDSDYTNTVTLALPVENCKGFHDIPERKKKKKFCMSFIFSFIFIPVVV